MSAWAQQYAQGLAHLVEGTSTACGQFLRASALPLTQAPGAGQMCPKCAAVFNRASSAARGAR